MYFLFDLSQVEKDLQSSPEQKKMFLSSPLKIWLSCFVLFVVSWLRFGFGLFFFFQLQLSDNMIKFKQIVNRAAKETELLKMFIALLKGKVLMWLGDCWSCGLKDLLNSVVDEIPFINHITQLIFFIL